jgi:hypothetical protein
LLQPAAIKGIIRAALTAADVVNPLERRGFAHDGGKRPADVTLIPSQDGCSLVGCHIPDMLAPRNITKAVVGPGAIAIDSVAKKCQ